MRLLMFRKLLLTSIVCLFASLSEYAQTGNLTGAVTDAKSGELIVGANIFLPSIQRGAATNADGEFTIQDIPVGEYTVRVTYVGYTTKNQTVQINANEDTDLRIALETGALGLDELVVSGYGAPTAKRELTGSITTVSSEDFEGVPVQNTESILQGRAAGVTVTTTSGNPGGAFSVNIRGNGSINASSEPLYIVDGVQISFAGQSGLTSQSPLNSIAPGDIASIEVLKGAAASAIYGSQAANGVVLITTKRGQSGDTQVSIRSETGVRNVASRSDLINTDQYLDYLGEARFFNGTSPSPEAGREVYENFLPGQYGSPTGSQADPAGDGSLADFDWQDFIYDQGVTQKHTVSASGGTDQTRFYVSGRYELTDGHISNSKFDAVSLRSNLDHKFSDKFTSSLNLNLSRQNQFGICQDGNFINCPPAQVVFEPPFSFAFFNNGEFSNSTNFGLSNNPAVIRDEVERNVQVISVLANLNLNYSFNDWLSATGVAGVDYRGVEDERFETPIARPAQGGRLAYDYRNVYNIITTATLNARQTFDEVHNVSGFIGTEYRRDYNTRVGTTGEGFPGSFFRVLNTASTPTEASGFNSEFRIGSYFGNAKYNFDERYFISLTGRYDGHSRFGADQRFGFFPSVSGAWRISEEDFFNSSVIDELKLRAGYGIVGNAAIGNFAARGLFSAVGSYSGNTALTPTQLANPDLTWEEAREINLGLDFELFSGRLTGALDVYQRDNDNLLLGRELPLESGFNEITENVGSVRNEGLEVELSSINVSSQDFFWSSRFNVGFIRQEVLDLGDTDVLNEDNTFSEIRVGETIGIIQVPDWAGVNPADGRPFFYDIDGNLTYTPSGTNDASIYKDGMPNIVGGFGNNISYKGIALDVFFQFSFGQWAFPQTDYYFGRTPDFLASLDAVVLDRWREVGDVTYYPRAITAGGDFVEASNFRTTLGTQSIYNASYIRLKNVSLSYSLPSSLTDKLNLRGVRFFASGLNLLTFTAWPFYDPEVAGDTNDIFGNVVAASFPTGKQFNGGIEIQF